MQIIEIKRKYHDCAKQLRNNVTQHVITLISNDIHACVTQTYTTYMCASHEVTTHTYRSVPSNQNATHRLQYGIYFVHQRQWFSACRVSRIIRTTSHCDHKPGTRGQWPCQRTNRPTINDILSKCWSRAAHPKPRSQRRLVSA